MVCDYGKKHTIFTPPLLIFGRYYEVKLLTDGMMRVGWATPSFPAHLPLGDDGNSYAFDGYLVSILHVIILLIITYC